MKKRIMLFLIFCVGSTLSFAQDAVIWKHVLRFSEDRYLPKGYIASKYRYCDNTLLYKMNYSDNGWQVIDSITYKKNNELWYISYFDTDASLRLHHRFSDTTQNLHYTNNALHYTIDKYGVLPFYLDGINELIFICKKQSPHLIQTHISDTCYFFFKDVGHTLLFAEYGISMEETLMMYCCYIGKHGVYDWDKFCFSGHTVVRCFEYDTQGNLCKVVITKTHEGSKRKTTWVNNYILMEE